MTKPSPHNYIMQIDPYVGGKSNVGGVSRIIKLSSNENPLGASPEVSKALMESFSKLNRYPDATYHNLKTAIANAHKINGNNIVVGAGSDELIGLLVHCFAGVGDEVIYSRHGFLMYKIYTISNGATPVVADENNLRTEVDSIIAKVTPRTKLVFIANPNNPTGSYITKSEVEDLRRRLPENVLLVIDGAYTEYVEANDYSGGLELVESTPNTCVIRTFSKVYGLSSLRLGWGYFPENVTDALNRVRGPFNVSTQAVAAGIAAINDTEFVKKSVAHNAAERTKLVNALLTHGIKSVPSQCNFILAYFGEGGAHNYKDANAYLLSKGLIVREVDNYDLKGYLRISIGSTEENEILIGAIAEFFRQ